LLLRAVDGKINLLGRLADCFRDGRSPRLVVHQLTAAWLRPALARSLRELGEEASWLTRRLVLHLRLVHRCADDSAQPGVAL
jgi:hypothetical protein